MCIQGFFTSSLKSGVHLRSTNESPGLADNSVRAGKDSGEDGTWGRKVVGPDVCAGEFIVGFGDVMVEDKALNKDG